MKFGKRQNRVKKKIPIILRIGSKLCLKATGEEGNLCRGKLGISKKRSSKIGNQKVAILASKHTTFSN